MIVDCQMLERKKSNMGSPEDLTDLAKVALGSGKLGDDKTSQTDRIESATPKGV